MSEIDNQISCIEAYPSLVITTENANKLIAGLGGTRIVEHGDDIAAVNYYITLLYMKSLV